MQRFDCLSRDSILLGPHLLEASAGTGKTFAIEQIYVRLILESKMEVDQILAITFTRAATRELKNRIRRNLEEAIAQLQENQILWDYLIPFRQEQIALNRLKEAANRFDQNQIYTIHGFCHRMLNEFSFEASLRFSLLNLENPQRENSDQLLQAVRDFLSLIERDLICAEQLHILLKKYKNVEKLADALIQEIYREKRETKNFARWFQEYKQLINSWEGCLDVNQITSDFKLIENHYKVEIKGKFDQQIKAFTQEPTFEIFSFLISEEASLFAFLSPSNRKVRAPFVATPSDSFFEWGRNQLLPFFQETTDPKILFQILLNKWIECSDKILKKAELFNPEFLLKKMEQALQIPLFLKKVQNRYKAAIIDEFQDTDLTQWTIFENLFIPHDDQCIDDPISAVYLVGDPKQSIYRFRKADIYTYLKAKEKMNPAYHYCLDTNFRSSPEMVGALNHLFSCKWFSLPKMNAILPYFPVHSGAKQVKGFNDGKGALHFCFAEEGHADKKWPSDRTLDQIFFPFIVNEIHRLVEETGSLNRFAILVKDRYQADQAVQFMKEHGLPALAKSHAALGETLAFQAFSELLEALIDVDNLKKARLVLGGPFGRKSASEIPNEIPSLFFDLQSILETRGLVPFLQMLFQSRFGDLTFLESVACEDVSFYQDLFHLIERLLEWEIQEGFSVEGLTRILREMALLKSNEDERIRRRMQQDDEAIQILTMHVSKGLEFDVVFALGLTARTPKPEEELEEYQTEKLRQLYVSMTRAKRRLYIPVVLDKKNKPPEGSEAPIELFLNIFRNEKSLEEVLEEAAQKNSMTWETLLPMKVDSTPKLPPITIQKPTPIRLDITPSYLHSFTSLSKNKQIDRMRYTSITNTVQSKEYTLHTLPKGAETGIILHSLFEKIFTSFSAALKEPPVLNRLVKQEISMTKLAMWENCIAYLLSEIINLSFLQNLDPKNIQPEVEFMYEDSPHFVKGFVDLVFIQNQTLYFIDWKSNWLGETDESYAETNLRGQMEANDYYLQASIYGKALSSSMNQYPFGGAYYLFVRGISSPSKGVLFVPPKEDNGILV